MALYGQFLTWPKDSPENELGTLAHMGILVFKGEQDIIIDNERLDAIYEHIPGNNKIKVTNPNVGHGPFSHQVIKHDTVKSVHEWF